MIPFIQKLTALDTLQPKFDKNRIQINTSLAFEIKVIKKLFANRYMLEVGKQQVETKSFMNLEPGAKYWATMRESKGVVQLQHLLKKPEYLQEKPPLVLKNFDFSMMQRPDIYKQTLVQSLGNTQSEKEFKFITDMLLGLHNNIITVPFEYNNRYALFQYKNKNKMSINKNSLEFFAEFVNLGPISGTVSTAAQFRQLDMILHFANSAAHLQEQTKNLNFDVVNISTGKPKPLYNLNNSLLDVKG